MKDLAIMLLILALVWALIRPLASDGAFVAEHQLRLAAEARVIALQATITALRPTPRPCYPPVAGRC